jgi:hypothetical protein
MTYVDIRDSEFFHAVMRDVHGPRQGGAILVVDAQDGRKGVGKTSAAISLARLFAGEFEYELDEDDLVLGGARYLKRLTEHPAKEQPSCVVWDEAVGAGSGDSRRAMAEQNRVLGQAWQTLRTKRILQFVTLPTWNELDVRLRRLADYRVWCQAQPIGCFKAYEVGLPFEGDGIQTRALGPDDSARRLEFPNLDAADDDLFRALEAKKAALIDADTFDADEIDALADGGQPEDEEPTPEEVEKREQTKTALRAVRPWDDDRGMSYRAAAKLTDFSHSWVADRVDEWNEGEHRDLVGEGEVLSA